MSRRLPHFDRESWKRLCRTPESEYVWIKELGGRRNKIRDDSPQIALRQPGFRNYADYMLTQNFEQGMAG